jgi:phosphohistidine swiveling domain-containing protein
MPSTWLPDPSHYPEQMSPLSATVWFEAVGLGLHEAMRELRGPFGGFEARTELGWAYEGSWEVDWEPVPGSLEAAATGLPERWETELAPRAHAITRELHGLRPERPAPADAVALMDRFWSQVLEQWTIHFLAVIPAQVGIEMLAGTYADAMGDEDALAPYRLLDWLPNGTTLADRALWELAERARELGLEDVLREYPIDVVRERLGELGNGRQFLHELDAYLLRWGGRARWHELSLPREAERPQITLESIRLFLETGAAPRVGDADDGARREAEILARAPALAAVLPVAKFAYVLKEEHVYHIDYPGLLATREVLLGFGRRLAAEGRLRDPEDVWMLRRTDVRAALADEDPGSAFDLDELVAVRRGELAEGRLEGPRAYLGDPPPDEERHAVLEKFYGRGAGGHSSGGIRGTGASPGTAEGTARLVAGPDDFRRVRPGDVLIAATTTPAWTPLFPSLAALVTETGGILSHGAIVAREYGLPAVVGAQGAMASIPDGARVRVDGLSGAVEILSSGVGG